MAHCVKVALEDVCTRSLQQEEALHSSGHTSITLSPTTGRTAAGNSHLREDSFYTCSERETPKMIAKVRTVLWEHILTNGCEADY